MSKELRAFVAGASGYVGREVVRELCRRGVHTIAHVRPDSASRERSALEFEEFGAQVSHVAWDLAPLTRTLKEIAPTHVFALLGTTKRRAAAAHAGAASYDAVDWTPTKRLVDASGGCEPRPRFVYLSSLGASPSARNEYLALRGQVEAYIRGSELPFTIARTSLISGPDRREWRPLERSLSLVVAPLLTLLGKLGAVRLRDRYAPLSARELAHGLVHAALNYTTIDRVLLTEELRYLTANDYEYFIPKSKRDTHRF